jgi:predicted O-linked N-acetylglucosamine transferase (SPINDLY family)
MNNVVQKTTIKNIQHVPRTQQNINEIAPDLVIVHDNFNDLSSMKYKCTKQDTVFAIWITSLPFKKDLPRKQIDLVDLFLFSSRFLRDFYVEFYDIPETKTKSLKLACAKKLESNTGVSISETKKLFYFNPETTDHDLYLLHQIISNVKTCFSLDIHIQDETFQNLSLFDNFENITIHKLLENKNVHFLDYSIYLSLQREIYSNFFNLMASGCLVITPDAPWLNEIFGPRIQGVPNYRNNEMFTKTYALVLDGLLQKPSQEILQIRQENQLFIAKNYTNEIVSKIFSFEVSNFVAFYQNYVHHFYKTYYQETLDAYNNNKYDETIVQYNKFQNLFPSFNDYFQINNVMGVALYKLEEFDKGREHFLICETLKTDFQIFLNLALLEFDANKKDKFFEYAEKALELDFNIELAHKLGIEYHHVNFEKAYKLYKKILAIKPMDISCLINCYDLDIMIKGMYNEKRTPEMENAVMRGISECIKNRWHGHCYSLVANLNLSSLYIENLNDQEFGKKVKLLGSMLPVNSDLEKISRQLNIYKKYKKCRVGYILADVRTHPVGNLLELIVQHHNVEKFDIFIYDNTSGVDSKSNLVKKRILSIPGIQHKMIYEIPDEKVVETIVGDDIDVLVEMMGWTGSNRMNLLMYRLAKVQVSYFAYAFSTGISNIDYKLTDKYASPDYTQEMYTEKLYRLPNCLQCFVDNKLVAVKRYNRQEPYTIHLGCFNNPKKLTNSVIRVFARILKELPNAKLFLKYGRLYNSSFYRQVLIPKFLDNGATKEQIDIQCNPSRDAYLDYYNDIDIALDPWPYSGGITSHEALYMNTPLISLEGYDYRTRIGTSLLRNLKLDKYVAKDYQDYINITVDLARNKKELHHLHKNLRTMMEKTDLSNPVSFTKNLEHAYQDMKNTYFENL